MQATRAVAKELFHLFLIKPSHYDDEGYVIQWARSSIPANTLATLYGLALDCAERRVLGDDVEIRITVWDETNTRIKPHAIIEQDARERRPRDWLASSACRPISFRAPWISPGRCVLRASPSASAASTSAAASRCCRTCRPSCRQRWIWASRCSPAKRKAGWTICCALPIAMR